MSARRADQAIHPMHKVLHIEELSVCACRSEQLPSPPSEAVQQQQQQQQQQQDPGEREQGLKERELLADESDERASGQEERQEEGQGSSGHGSELAGPSSDPSSSEVAAASESCGDAADGEGRGGERSSPLSRFLSREVGDRHRQQVAAGSLVLPSTNMTLELSRFHQLAEEVAGTLNSPFFCDADGGAARYSAALRVASLPIELSPEQYFLDALDLKRHQGQQAVSPGFGK